MGDKSTRSPYGARKKIAHRVIGDKFSFCGARLGKRVWFSLHGSQPCRVFGSMASRNPSPIKLILNTVKKMAKPGNNAMCGADSR